MKLNFLLAISICLFFIGCSQEKEINISQDCKIRYILNNETKSIMAIEIKNKDNSAKINYITNDCFSFFVGAEKNICQGTFGDNGFSSQMSNSNNNCVVNKTEYGLLIDANTEDGYRTVVEYNEDLKECKHHDCIENNSINYFVTKEGNLKIK